MKNNIKKFDQFLNELNASTYRSAAKQAEEAGDWELSIKFKNKADKIEKDAPLVKTKKIIKKIKSGQEGKINLIINNVEKEFFIDIENIEIVVSELDEHSNKFSFEIHIKIPIYGTITWSIGRLYSLIRLELDINDEKEFRKYSYSWDKNNINYTPIIHKFQYQILDNKSFEIVKINDIVSISKQEYLKLKKILKSNLSLIFKNSKIEIDPISDSENLISNNNEEKIAYDFLSKLIDTNKLKRLFRTERHTILKDVDFSMVKHSQTKTKKIQYLDGDIEMIPEKLDLEGVKNFTINWLNNTQQGKKRKKQLEEYFNDSENYEDNYNYAHYFEIAYLYVLLLAITLDLNISKLEQYDDHNVILRALMFEPKTKIVDNEDIKEYITEIGKSISNNYEG